MNLPEKQPGDRLERCKRCGRRFRMIKEGQEFGPKCARKMAVQLTLPDGTIEVRDAKGELTAGII